jgi:ketosteroid isomerase-like protein
VTELRRWAMGTAITLLFSGCLLFALQEPEHDELVRLNRAILEKVIVERDAEALVRFTYENFLVVPPGGIVEDRAEALAGIEAFRKVKSIAVSDERVAVQGDTAVVVGKLVIEGEVPPIGKVPPTRFVAVFARQDGQWRMLARTLTPCLPMVLQAGRC